MEKQVVQFQFGGQDVTLETGAVARQATGAVMITMGETQILATVVGYEKPQTRPEFLPTVSALSREDVCGR
jgi:Polyribonucleotide nucleotidyltransferase (polynucleotide phosphorylase)